MSEGTKRPRATEPPRQGGGFVTGGEDAWTQQDPDTWANAWTAEWPFKATDAKLYGIECHEGNYAIEHFLRGARFEERERGRPR